MTSTIKVDNIQKVSDGSNIIKKCGSTITIGSCGQTVAVATGATTSGMGRTGTVDWQTVIKTGDFTAANGEGYFVNTTSGAVTMTLPASPSAGNIVSVKDYAYKFGTNALTVGRNGSPIGGGSGFDPTYETDGAFLTFIYADAVKGWLLTDESNNTTDAAQTFISATGGTITTVCTDFKVHTFTGPGTFCVSAAAGPVANVSYMVVAGGAGGGGSHGGGGGAGGFREGKTPTTPYTASPIVAPAGLPVSIQAYPITVGAGGSGGGPNTSDPNGGDGSVSTFSSITSAGGGGGATESSGPGVAGGSGGGGSYNPNYNQGGAGNTPPVSPPQGQPGGTGQIQAGPYKGGGGGGAKCAGSAFDSSDGKGGDGQTTSINATPTAFAGGGGSGGTSYGQPAVGAGGAGGGGAGGGPGSTAPSATANTGGGGGAHGNTPAGNAGGAGGAGVVVIRIPSVAAPAITVSPGTNTNTAQPDGTTVARFTADGTLSVAQFP